MAADPINGATWLLSFHGSEISRAWLSEGQDLHIAFSAAAATQADRTEGYLSGITLVMSQARGELVSAIDPANTPTPASGTPSYSEDDISLLLGGIAEGHLTVHGQPRRQLPVPGDQTGPLSLNLRLISGTHLSASGHSLRIELAESTAFRESWAC